MLNMTKMGLLYGEKTKKDKVRLNRRGKRNT